MSGQTGFGAGRGGTGPGSRFGHHTVIPGYDEEEVDELIERIEATLAGTAAPRQAVTAREVEATQFSMVRRLGRRRYDMESVDIALDAYVERLARL